MHYIGEVTLPLLTSFAENMCTARFSFFPLGGNLRDEARYENYEKQN
jgi:hypothetical protein